MTATERVPAESIPSEWQCTTVGAAYEIHNQKRMPLSRDRRSEMLGSYPYYGPTGVLDYINEYRFEGTYALIGEDGDHFLKFAKQPMTLIVRGRFNVNNHAHVIGARGSNTIEWFQKYFENRDLTSHLTRQGASRYKLTKAALKDLHITIPSKREQTLIAIALSHVDEFIGALERLIAKKHAVKQGVMQQLLTGKTRLPGFAEPWSDVRLGDHATYVKTVPLSRAQLDGTSPLKYLHYGDIHTRVGVTLDAAHESMPRVTASLAGRAGKLLPGDLVFADASEDPAGVGKSVEIVTVPSEGVVPGLHTIAARFNKTVLADGFKAYLQFIPTFRDSLLRLAAGTKVLATTRSYISSVTLSLPGVAEQAAIAEVLTSIETEIVALRARLVKAQHVKAGMVQQLLTGRTRLSLAQVE